ERFATALQHARLALRLQGDTRKTALEFRKHFGWYTKGLRDGSELRQRLFAIESMAEAEAIFAEYLAGASIEIAAEDVRAATVRDDRSPPAHHPGASGGDLLSG